MAVTVSPTPNPNALKFTVGRDVGGPKTFIPGQDVDDPAAAAIIDIEGVTSVFMTADFVTLTKHPDAGWDDIAPAAQQILEAHYPD
jgi:hypothetical protein